MTTGKTIALTRRTFVGKVMSDFYILFLKLCEFMQAMTNLDNILKSKEMSLPTKAHIIKALIFPVVMYGCESWTIKKAEH